MKHILTSKCPICGVEKEPQETYCQKCADSYERTLDLLANTLRERFDADQLYDKLNQD